MSIRMIGIAVVFLMGILASSVAAQRCDVPPKRGTVYIVVKYAPYNSRDTLRGGTKTRVKINWGPNKFDRKFPGLRPPASAGVVIAARHSQDDSIPLFIETNGTLELCRQLDRAPSYPMYQNANW
ncbi:MAG: hypothetical protein IPL32_03590 [Chloracidobacterium sp.]|nr:hypothetical protein [Chloracidobacterium sp.]